jgi:hypothetical protein
MSPLRTLAAAAALSAVVPLALACTPPEPTEWTAFVVTVQTQANNPLSVAAVAAMQAQFCDDFEISPCEADASAGDDELHLTKDFELYVPNEGESRAERRRGDGGVTTPAIHAPINCGRVT